MREDEREEGLVFAIGDEQAVGVLHRGRDATTLGVVIIVGGPQYRAGSHRQFVLLARSLAAAGYPVLRFDYRGSGDSGGAQRGFEEVDTDIRTAIEILIDRTGVSGVVLWGLCDAASAAMLYAQHDDRRIAGLVLVNPWVHAPTTAARVRLKRYYAQRLRNPELWRKLFNFEFAWRGSVASLWSYLRAAARSTSKGADAGHFIERMLRGWSQFAGPSLLVLSEADLTADEFRQLCAESTQWQMAATRSKVRRIDLAGANHTFSSAVSRKAVEDATLAWLAVLGGPH